MYQSLGKPLINLKKDVQGAISDDLYEIVLRSQVHQTHLFKQDTRNVYNQK